MMCLLTWSRWLDDVDGFDDGERVVVVDVVVVFADVVVASVVSGVE